MCGVLVPLGVSTFSCKSVCLLVCLHDLFFCTMTHCFIHSYNAIKAYVKEGRHTELSATEHLVSAAEAG